MTPRYSADDPVAFEIFKHRLWSVCERAHFTLSRVSGSPIVVDAHEYLCGIHKADGEAVMVTSGVLLHVVGMHNAIRRIREWWQDEEEGIADGDQFLVNDAYIAAVHAVDMSISKPVFYGGQLVAWVNSLFHTPSMPSALEAGGQCPTAVNVYQEGFRSQGLKIVEKGRVRKDVMRSLCANAPDPDLLGLDHAAKIAANNSSAEEIIKIIDEFGLEFVLHNFDRTVSDAEAICRDRIRRLPDGEWTSVLYQDTNGQETLPLPVRCTLTKSGDNIRFDYSGTAPQQRGSFQCSAAGALSHLFVVLASQLFWDAPWCGALTRVVEYRFPEGSILNVDPPGAVSMAAIITAVENVTHQCLAKMYVASEDLREEVNAGWCGGGSAPSLFGRNQYGKTFSTVLMDSFAAGEGARVDCDGVDTGGLMMAAESEISNCETHEMFYPILYVWRRQRLESIGHGRFRGGLGVEYAITPHNAPDGQVGNVNVLTGNVYSITPGLFGGYPGGLRRMTWSRNTQLQELFAQGRVPTELRELGGDTEIVQATSGQRPFRAGDVLITTVSGGGGYGDPIERNPVAVLSDVRNRFIRFDSAARIYGVVIDPERMTIDAEASSRLRAAIRQERLARGRAGATASPSTLSVDPERPRLRMTEHLWFAVTGDGPVIVCDRCDHVLCSAGQPYRHYALSADRLPSEVGLVEDLHPTPESGMVLREFYCPGCGTLLDVESTFRDAPILDDVRIDYTAWLELHSPATTSAR